MANKETSTMASVYPVTVVCLDFSKLGDDSPRTFFCSSLLMNPFVGVRTGPHQRPLNPAAFRDLLTNIQVKIDSDNLSLEDLGQLITKIKVQKLSLPGDKTQDYLILKKENYDLLLDTKTNIALPQKNISNPTVGKP